MKRSVTLHPDTTEYLSEFKGPSPQTTFHSPLKGFAERALEFALIPLIRPYNTLTPPPLR